MSVFNFHRSGVALLALLALGACSVLSPSASPRPSFYTLDRPLDGAAPRAPTLSLAPTLIVSPTHAAAGFDSPRIIYVREAHRLDYFAHSEWVDPPARMLTPLLVAAAQASGSFRAVVLTPTAAAGDMRLDTEIVRLQHDFQSRPSQVRFTLRVYLIENKTRRVLAWRELDATVAASSEDAYGGVVAANRAVQTVLAQAAAFLTDALDKVRWP
ncbi:ABC-type transport auxiliary lipoprotein family protein [Rhodoferax sp.]|uniref:ABC-type transport auxiliary lipoprotein family protein n=1 Tax=Rhodoferax sp. TaxID=50421 RepID=UPI002752C6DC|nr:ABC-type transport auxiliary lipoprotein family protein [Rhodoferax sp.]